MCCAPNQSPWATQFAADPEVQWAYRQPLSALYGRGASSASENRRPPQPSNRVSRRMVSFVLAGCKPLSFRGCRGGISRTWSPLPAANLELAVRVRAGWPLTNTVRVPASGSDQWRCLVHPDQRHWLRAAIDILLTAHRLLQPPAPPLFRPSLFSCRQSASRRESSLTILSHGRTDAKRHYDATLTAALRFSKADPTSGNVLIFPGSKPVANHFPPGRGPHCKTPSWPGVK